MQNAYEVKFSRPPRLEDGDLGPFIIIGPNPEMLRRLIESNLTSEELDGEPYDLNFLAINISGVNEDVEKGRILRPQNVEEFVKAILAEFRANFALTTTEAFKNLFALQQKFISTK